MKIATEDELPIDVTADRIHAIADDLATISARLHAIVAMMAATNIEKVGFEANDIQEYLDILTRFTDEFSEVVRGK